MYSNRENECVSAHSNFSFKSQYATLIEETFERAWNSPGPTNRTLNDSSRHLHLDLWSGIYHNKNNANCKLHLVYTCVAGFFTNVWKTGYWALKVIEASGFLLERSEHSRFAMIESWRNSWWRWMVDYDQLISFPLRLRHYATMPLDCIHNG